MRALRFPAVLAMKRAITSASKNRAAVQAIPTATATRNAKTTFAPRFPAAPATNPKTTLAAKNPAAALPIVIAREPTKNAILRRMPASAKRVPKSTVRTNTAAVPPKRQPLRERTATARLATHARRSAVRRGLPSQKPAPAVNTRNRSAAVRLAKHARTVRQGRHAAAQAAKSPTAKAAVSNARRTAIAAADRSAIRLPTLATHRRQKRVRIMVTRPTLLQEIRVPTDNGRKTFIPKQVCAAQNA